MRVPAAEFDRAWAYLLNGGHIAIRSRKADTTVFRLSKKGEGIMVSAFNFGAIGGAEAAGLARSYAARELARGNFVSVAKQRAGPCPNLVVYDYDRNVPVAVEVETHDELLKHSEQVEKNAEKNFGLGFGMTVFVTSSDDAGLAREAIGERRGVLHAVV